MKRWILLLPPLLPFLFGIANRAAAREPEMAPLVSMKLRNMPLPEALGELRRKTGWDMVYADQPLAEVILSCPFREQPARDWLPVLLKDAGVGFRWVEPRRLLIYPLDEHEVFSLQGTVATSLGPLAGVGISIQDSARVAVTDANGAFSLQRLPRKPVKLRVHAEGYARVTLEVNPEQESSPLTILLVERPFLAEHLIVSQPFGSPKREFAGESLEISRPEEVIKRGTTSHDLYQGLRAIPGVAAGAREGGVSFRGARPSENLVLVDGIKVYQLDHALGHFSALNPDAISEVHIYKGAYPAFYGDRVAGVLDIRAKGDRLGTREIRAGVDRDQGHAALLLPLGYQAALMVSARQSHSDTTVRSVSDRIFASTFGEEQETFEELDFVQNDRRFRFEDQMLRLTWRPNLKDSFGVTLFRGRDRSRESLEILAAPLTETAYLRDGDWGNDGMSFRWTHQWNAHQQTRFLLSQSRFRSNFHFDQYYASVLEGAPRFIDRLNHIDEESFQLQHQFRLPGNHGLMLGVFSSKVLLDWSEFIAEERTDAFEFRTRQKGAFLQLEREHEGFHALLGLRAGDNELSETRFLEPRASLSLDLGSAVRVRGSWGRFHQFILRSPDTVNYFSGLPTWFPAFEGEILPGFSEHFQVGGRYRKQSFLVDLEAYYKVQEGSLMNFFDPLRHDFELQQIAETYRGIDLRLEKSGKFWSAGLGYSYQRGRVTEDLYENEPLDFPTDRDRPHTLHTAVSLTKSRWEWTAIGRFSSGTPYELPEVVTIFNDFGEEELELVEPEERNALRLPDLYQLDMRVDYSLPIGRGVANLGVSITNLFDHRNVNDRLFVIELDEEEEQEAVPIDVLDFGFRLSLDARVRF